MNKKLIKRVYLRSTILNEHPVKWIIEYWLTNPNDEGSFMITVLTTKFFVPLKFENVIEGTKVVRRFKDRVLLERSVTIPEPILNQIGLQIPSQMEVKQILEKGYVQVVRQKRN